jgi:hypothetical protein
MTPDHELHGEGDANVVAHPHRFTLRGDPANLVFPPLCAHCGAVAAGTLVRAKAFYREASSGTSRDYAVNQVAVPFCTDCIGAHACAVQARAPSLAARLALDFGSFENVGAVALGAAALFFAYLALKFLLRADLIGVSLPLVMCLVLAWAARHQLRLGWRATGYRRLPPTSDITRAFDFSDDIAEPFEPPRFVCTVRDAHFAAAFGPLNRDRVWSAASPAAVADRRAARRRLWLIGGVLATLALGGLMLEWLGVR